MTIAKRTQYCIIQISSQLLDVGPQLHNMKHEL